MQVGHIVFLQFSKANKWDTGPWLVQVGCTIYLLV